MSVLRHRILATAIEGSLCAAVCSPAYFLTEQDTGDRWVAFAVWLAVSFALAPLILAIRALTQKHPAPDHRRRGLYLRGTGCHVCRWMRFWWPLAIAPAGVAGGLFFEQWGLGALSLAVTAVHLATALSDLAEEKEPHWARATGFRFDPGKGIGGQPPDPRSI